MKKLVIAGMAIVALSACSSTHAVSDDVAGTESPVADASTSSSAPEVAPTTIFTPPPPPPAPPKPTLTIGQQNALSKAQDYLGYTSFSRKSLIEQLQYEGFAPEDATFAVDKIAPDWNAQAGAKAKEYMDYTSFSRSSLIEQLQYEGFSPAEAEYGASQVGF